MPFATATILTLTSAAAGIGVSAKGYIDQKNANAELTAASNRAEALRKQQAELQAQREQRKLFQEEARSRAQINAGLAASGATYGSIAGGLTGNTEGLLNQNSVALAQNIQIGENLFQANADAAQARADLNTSSATIDLGKSLFSNAKQIGSIGQTLYPSNPNNNNGG